MGSVVRSLESDIAVDTCEGVAAMSEDSKVPSRQREELGGKQDANMCIERNGSAERENQVSASYCGDPERQRRCGVRRGAD